MTAKQEKLPTFFGLYFFRLNENNILKNGLYLNELTFISRHVRL